MYCDLHGHSRKKNVFVYGCAPRAGTVSINEFNQCRLLPFIMSQIGKEKYNGSLDESEEGRKERKLRYHSKDRGLYTNISMADSHFKVSRSKRGTARCVVFRELGVSNSLTVEASFCGPGDNRNEKRRLREWKKRARIRAAEGERRRAALKAESMDRCLGSGENQNRARDQEKHIDGAAGAQTEEDDSGVDGEGEVEGEDDDGVSDVGSSAQVQNEDDARGNRGSGQGVLRGAAQSGELSRRVQTNADSHVNVHYDVRDFVSMARCLCDSLLVYCGMEDKLGRPTMTSSTLLDKLNKACEKITDRRKRAKDAGKGFDNGDGDENITDSRGDENDENEDDVEDGDLSFALGFDDADSEEEDVGSDSDPSADNVSDVERLICSITKSRKGSKPIMLHRKLGKEIQKRKQRDHEKQLLRMQTETSRRQLQGREGNSLGEHLSSKSENQSALSSESRRMEINENSFIAFLNLSPHLNATSTFPPQRLLRQVVPVVGHAKALLDCGPGDHPCLDLRRTTSHMARNATSAHMEAARPLASWCLSCRGSRWKQGFAGMMVVMGILMGCSKGLLATEVFVTANDAIVSR